MADKKAGVMKHMGQVKEGEKKPAKRHVHKMEIERGAKGGFVAHHHMKGGEKEHEESRTGPHVIADTDALHDHMDEHMGDQPAAGEGEAPGGADPNAAPAEAAAPMMAGGEQ